VKAGSDSVCLKKTPVDPVCFSHGRTNSLMEDKMAKLSVSDLKNLKEKVSKDMSLREGNAKILVTVHMGTCGIASGAREVMDALMKEMEEADRQDIRVMAAGCLGMCSSEPNVTVEIEGQAPIAYQYMDANKMRQVFKRHILKGEVQSDFALAKM
jgi:NADP-reducing hydrogenase subunit HndB